MSDTLDIDQHLHFSASAPDGEIDFTHSEFTERVGGGFNEHGVRENTTDGHTESVDVIFQAMEPGPPERRNGVRITPEFLERVGSKEYEQNPPHLKDHNDTDTFARIGEVRDAWFSERLGKLMLMTRTPNIEGSQNHSEAVARYTHDPPAIRDGSLGFGNNYEAVMNDDGEPEMRDGKFREFSTVNFPGGYDEGGVNTAFAEAVGEYSEHGEDGPEELDETYSEWSDAVNMTASQLESWSDHPCADEASEDPEAVRKRNLRLLNKNKSEWTSEDVSDAKRTISFIDRMDSDESSPEDPREGPGTCPSPWAISLLNWAYNPFDSMPDGNPDPGENSVHTTTVEFEGHMGEEEGGPGPEMEEKAEVFETWNELTNMTEAEMEMWEDHPCSDKGVDGGEGHRDNFMMLMGQGMDRWDMESLQIANRAVDFMVSETEKDPENPESGGPGTCPSRWAVNLLNRGHNPFANFPSGNPQFTVQDVTKFDDPAGDTDKPGENLAAEGETVDISETQF